MRVTPLILALPALAAAAEQQIPILDQVKGWFSKATVAASSYASSVPAASSVPNPVNAAASVVADGFVERLTLENHRELLKPGSATANPGIEEWMLFVTGGNKSCLGRCGHAEAEWNRSVARLSASRNAPHLAMLDCEAQPVLCNAWALGAPSIVHMLLPQPLADQSTPATSVRYITLNSTAVSSADIVAIHAEETYKLEKPYEGLWHPFDGPLAKTGMNINLGWALWGIAQIPSWMIMLSITMGSRFIMYVSGAALIRYGAKLTNDPQEQENASRRGAHGCGPSSCCPCCPCSPSRKNAKEQVAGQKAIGD